MPSRLHKFLWKRATLVFSLFMAGGLAGILGVQTTFYGPSIWVLKWLTAPMAIAAALFTRSGWQYFRKTQRLSPKRIMLGATLVPLLLLLFSTGYVSILNAAFPTAERVTFRGVVTWAWSPRRSFEDLRVTLQDEMSAQEQTFYVKRSEEKRVRVGEPYQVDMVIGCLGIPFQPNWPFDAAMP